MRKIRCKLTRSAGRWASTYLLLARATFNADWASRSAGGSSTADATPSSPLFKRSVLAVRTPVGCSSLLQYRASCAVRLHSNPLAVATATDRRTLTGVQHSRSKRRLSRARKGPQKKWVFRVCVLWVQKERFPVQHLHLGNEISSLRCSVRGTFFVRCKFFFSCLYLVCIWKKKTFIHTSLKTFLWIVMANKFVDFSVLIC